jgi:hypothetical protein
MGTLVKFVILCLVLILVVSGLFLLKLNEQSIPKPSVPQFTVIIEKNIKLVNTTDQFTPRFLEMVNITNQPFTPYFIQQDGANLTINLFFNIAVNYDNASYWFYYSLHNGSAYGNLVQDNQSQFTVVYLNGLLPYNGTVLLRIQTLVGYEHLIYTPGKPMKQYFVAGSASDWSDNKTIIMQGGIASIPFSESSVPNRATNPPSLGVSSFP